MRAQKEQPTPTAAAGAVWFLYILECCDGSFYTGVTTDIDRRLREHQEGTASRYTRTRRPVVLAYREECGSRSLSLARECAVKSLGQRYNHFVMGGISPEPCRLADARAAKKEFPICPTISSCSATRATVDSCPT